MYNENAKDQNRVQQVSGVKYFQSEGENLTLVNCTNDRNSVVGC